MKKFFFLTLCLLWGVTALSAQNRRAFYVYADGMLNDICYTKDVRHIIFPPSTEEGADPNQPYYQDIRTGKFVNRLPLSHVDSISFIAPQPLDMKQPGRVAPITQEAFRTLVWDYKESPKQLVFRGDKPVIIDYWAKWCGYCIEMMPIMDQLAQEYKGKIDFYKIDTDEETELDGVLGVSSLPCFYFYPRKGEPAVRYGMMDLASMRNLIEKFLLIGDEGNPDAQKPAIEVEAWRGDLKHEWTDRKVTAHLRCTTGNATLIKYGCFKKEDFLNSGLNENDFIRQYGQVLPEHQLPQANAAEGLSLVFPVKRNTDYVFFCLAQNADGGNVVEKAEVKTDAKFVPNIAWQLCQGAIADWHTDHTKHVTFFMKCKNATEAHYLKMKQTDYDAAIAAGSTDESLLAEKGASLDAAALAASNGIGYTGVFRGMEEMTDYVFLAGMRNAEGKISTARESLRMPFDGYNDLIPYPGLSVITLPLGTGFTASVGCTSGDAIYAAYLTLPSGELSRLLAGGQTLEEVIATHPKRSVVQDEQLVWFNAMGISNVYNDMKPNARYTCVSEVWGRFGGRTVLRSDVQTLGAGETAPALSIILTSSGTENSLTASATCSSANAASATAVLLESRVLEGLLAGGKQLEDISALEGADLLTRYVFTPEQLTWFNQNGFVFGYTGSLPNTRYTWVIDARSADGGRAVQRVEVLTPKQAR